MAHFKDKKDLEWEVNIDAPMIMKIRDDCDPNFLLNDDEKDNTYIRMQLDPVLLCRVVFLLCTKQRHERSITEEEFYMQVIGNAIDRASEAMLEAIQSFIPRRTRTLLEMFAIQDKLQQEAIEKAVVKINSPELREKLQETLETKIDAEYQRVVTQLENVTNMQDLSESTQED